MDSMEPDVKFVGVKLEPGVKVRFPKEEEDNSMWTIHITQFALAHPAKPGKNVITLMNEEGEFVLGTLEANRCEQFQGDFMLAEPVVLVNQGKSSVHLTGYQTTTDVTDNMIMSDDEDLGNGLTASQVRNLARLGGQEGSSGDDSEDEDYDGEGGASSDEEEAPEGLPLQSLTKAKAKCPSLRIDELDDVQGKRGAQDDVDLDDEEEEMLAEAGLEVEDEDDDDDEDEGDEEEEEMGSSGEDEGNDEKVDPETQKKELAAASKILKQQKRQAEAGKETPSSKKIKLDATPAATPGPGLSEPDKEWLKLIRAYVAKEGPTRLSDLGSRVKKPQGAGKLKKLIEDSKALNLEEDKVTLVK